MKCIEEGVNEKPEQALADTENIYVLNTGGRAVQTVAVPAPLFEEVDFAKIDRDFEKPPILPTPLARESPE